MATVYYRNTHSVYTIAPYTRPSFWLAGLGVVIIFLVLLGQFFNTLLALLPTLLVFITLLAWQITIFWRRFRQSKSLAKYLVEAYSEHTITKSLLATMTVNRLQNTPYIAVPSVTVHDHRPSHITVEIEKLPGMYEIEKLTEDINASFRGKLGGYAVTSAMITTDGLTYKFVLEDVATDKTWRPATSEDVQAVPYILTLQDGLVVNLAERAHVAVWGKTGSKKTTVLLGMVLQLFSMGADVRFIDGKDEFSAFKGFYPADKIVSEVEDVLTHIEDVLAIVKHRQQVMAKESCKRQKMGLKASQLGLRPVAVVADEIGSIVALMDTKQAKQFINGLATIIQRGRSVGVVVIASTQDPSVDTLPQKIRQQFSTRILLGSANGDTQRMAFGEVATVGDIEDFRGFYTCDGLTKQPMKFYVCDLYSNGFNDLRAFNRAYELGLKVLYIDEPSHHSSSHV